jgi:hypothetical protein
MEIRPNQHPQPPAPAAAKKRLSKARSRGGASIERIELADPGLLDAISAGLDDLPEVRPERLIEGRQLRDDPDYPDSKGRDELARLALRSDFNSNDTDAGTPSSPPQGTTD